jgi:hypothetical protein
MDVDRAFNSPMRALVLCCACACGGVATRPAAVTGTERPVTAVHFVPGEHMEWEVRWFGVLVGRVQLAVGREGIEGGARTMVIRSVAQSDGALAVAKRGQMELLTWVDIERGLPLAQSGSFDEIYSGEVLGARFGATEWPRSPWLPDLGGGQVAQSTHSLLGLLRGWRPALGDRTTVFVRLRHRLLRIDLVASARQRTSSPLGRRSALRIDGVALPVGGDLEPSPGQRSYPLSLWIDEGGAERVPVRIEIESGFGGLVRLDLVTYDPPGSLAATATGRPVAAR